MIAIIDFLKVKKYYNKKIDKIKKMREDNFFGDTEIDSDFMNMIFEITWKYYEAEISRGNKIISKAQVYCGAVGLILSIFSVASKDTIVSLKNWNCYKLVLMLLFLATIGYFLLAAISSLSAIQITNVYKIGDGDIVGIQNIPQYNQNSNPSNPKWIYQKHMVNKLIFYTKINEQTDNAIATYVAIAQASYRKGIIGLVAFLMIAIIF